MTLTAVEVPRDYLNALPGGPLQQITYYQDLVRQIDTFDGFTDKDCTLITAHTALFRNGLFTSISGDDDNRSDTLVGMVQGEGLEVEGHYLNHQTLEQDPPGVDTTHLWGKLYVTVGLYVTLADKSEPEVFVTALRRDSSTHTWRLPYEKAVDLTQHEPTITVLQPEPGAARNVALSDILTTTLRARAQKGQSIPLW